MSVYRDYILLLPGTKDQALANIPTKPLQERSAETAGTSHPTILMLVAPAAGTGPAPSMARDEEKNTWGAIIPLNLDVKGGAGPSPFNVQLIVIGIAAT